MENPNLKNDKTQPDENADKSGSDANSDMTAPQKGKFKFEKPGKEKDPDHTGIDKEADKTTIENTII